MKNRRYFVLIAGLVAIIATTAAAIVGLFKVSIWHKYIDM